MVENDNSIIPLVVADISEIIAERHNKNITTNFKLQGTTTTAQQKNTNQQLANFYEEADEEDLSMLKDIMSNRDNTNNDYQGPKCAEDNLL